MTEKNPTISVLMAVYNGERYLGAAMKSILSQTFGDFEFIVVDDGSTDASAAIVRSFADPRVRLERNVTNQGLIASLNKGLDLARGEFVARMDADDMSLPGRFAAQLAAFRQHRDLAVCGTNYYSTSGARRSRSKARGDNGYLKTLLLFAPCFSHPTVMIRRSALNGVRYDPLAKHAEDYRLWVDLSGAGEYMILPEPLVVYRHHPLQISHTRKQEQVSVSSTIREDYLKKMGIRFNISQMIVHNQLGNNTPARTLGELRNQELWLKELLAQIKQKNIFALEAAAALLHKYWIDACGNTSLGLAAFSMARNSELSRVARFSFSERIKLLVKCLYRASLVRSSPG